MVNNLPQKTIRVKFLMYGPFDHTHQGTYANFIYSILVKHFFVEISEEPDYIFYHESDTTHLNYNCIKIFYTGENISPNFNFCDYAISFDWVNFEDRHFRMPLFLVNNFYRASELEISKNIDFTTRLNLTKQDLHEKTEFCSFVYSNYRGEVDRIKIFDLLSTYKKVNSGGAFLNNTGGRVDNKLAFEGKHKFSIAFENSSRSGYTTEKIVTSIMAKTIPIYWGDPNVAKQFNSERFINCHDYKNIEAVLDRVKEIDANDNLYLDIVNKPVLADDFDIEEVKNDFELFLMNIFNQPLSLAKRATINKSRLYDLIMREKSAIKYMGVVNLLKKFTIWCYKPFKKIPGVDRAKQKFLRNQL